MDTNIYAIMRNAWPEWRIVEKIGKGQFATVYRAVREDGGIEEWAAIKAIMIPEREEIEELRTEGLTDSQIYTYFQGIVRDYTREIQLMNSVKGHPNVVHIEDYSIMHSREEMRWIILIRMELLTPLTQWAAGRTITERDVLKMGVDLCRALVACQEKNIVHRDIAPKNIFVDREGRFKLGDFGVARTLEKTTNNFTKAGTPFYMAPEVYKGLAQTTDLRTAVKVDVYSLGLVLYWAANGERLPFVPLNKPVPTPEDRRGAFVRRMNGEEIPEPHVGQGLGWVILHATEYEVEDRYENAGEMLGDLQILMTGKVSPELKKYGQRRKKKKKNKKPITRISQSDLTASERRWLEGSGSGNGGSGKRRNTGQEDGRGKRIALIALIVLLAAAAIWFGYQGIMKIIDSGGGPEHTSEPTETDTVTWETPEPSNNNNASDGGDLEENNVQMEGHALDGSVLLTTAPTGETTTAPAEPSEGPTPTPTAEPAVTTIPEVTAVPTDETNAENVETEPEESDGRARIDSDYLDVAARENPAPYAGETSHPLPGDNDSDGITTESTRSGGGSSSGGGSNGSGGSESNGSGGSGGIGISVPGN